MERSNAHRWPLHKSTWIYLDFRDPATRVYPFSRQKTNVVVQPTSISTFSRRFEFCREKLPCSTSAGKAEGPILNRRRRTLVFPEPLCRVLLRISAPQCKRSRNCTADSWSRLGKSSTPEQGLPSNEGRAFNRTVTTKGKDVNAVRSASFVLRRRAYSRFSAQSPTRTGAFCSLRIHAWSKGISGTLTTFCPGPCPPGC